MQDGARERMRMEKGAAAAGGSAALEKGARSARVVGSGGRKKGVSGL